MHTSVCDMLDIEFPIFAFTHCRDVVAAVSKAGGFGVLGAVGFTPEQLEIELAWIDEHVGDKPYGVDVVIPGKYEGQGTEDDPEKLAEMLREMVPAGHLALRQGHPRPARRARAARGGLEQPAAARLDGGDRHPAGRRRPAAPEGAPHRQRAGHPAGRDRHPHQGERPTRRRPVRIAVPGAQAQGGGDRHHHRPGRRGRRPHRRGRIDRAVAPGGRGGGADPDAGRRRRRHRSADRGRARARRAGRVERLAVADRRGGRHPAGPEAAAARRHQPRHRAVPLVHGQALPHDPQRLDRRLGASRHPRSPADAAAVHGLGRLRGPRVAATPTRRPR